VLDDIKDIGTILKQGAHTKEAVCCHNCLHD